MKVQSTVNVTKGRMDVGREIFQPLHPLYIYIAIKMTWKDAKVSSVRYLTVPWTRYLLALSHVSLSVYFHKQPFMLFLSS
jgi:hypothetical protein